MHSIKLFTARQCNKRLQTSKRFWQQESYDHWVRDSDEMERIICYVENNPVRAGLVQSPAEWRYSSARVRASGIEFGMPIPKPMVT